MPLAPPASWDPPLARARFLVRLWHRLGQSELLTVGSLLLLAAALRWPYLQDVPRYTDELQEILWSLDIAEGRILPLTAVDSYYGPLWSYILAGLFVLMGPSPYLPRVVAAIVGVGLILATYLLARAVAGRGPAIIAAALMVTSGGHLIINSHTARSNNLTPLLTTLAILLLWRALEPANPESGRIHARPRHPALLLAVGLLLGLALQTHVSVIALLPGIALYALWKGWYLLRTPWPYLAALAGALGYVNMIIYNLLTNFWSFRHARSLQEGYAAGRSTDADYYLTNLSSLIQSLSRLLSGTIDVPDSPARYAYAALAILGLVVLTRRCGALLALAALSVCLVLPYFNPRYGPILSGRYLIPLLPIGFTAIGVALCLTADQIAPVRLRRLVVVGASFIAVTFPIWPLSAYYGDALAEGRTNAPLHQLYAAVLQNREGNEAVLLDEGLSQEQLGAGGTDLKALRMLLGTSGVPYTVAKVGESDVVLAEQGSILLIAEAKKRESLPRTVRSSTLTSEIESASGSEHRYVLYRLTSRG